MEGIPHAVDVCIVCALYEEALAVLDEFSTRCAVSFTPAFRQHTRLEYRFTTIKNTCGEPLSVLVTWLSRMGSVRAALDLVALLQEVRPRFVAMAGICAGDRSRVRLGDLILVTDAYHPEEGKASTDDDGQLVHWPETRMAGATTQILQYVQSFGQWREPLRELHEHWLPRLDAALPEPLCHLGVMASSMAVRADNPFAVLTSRYHRKTIGMDMEATAFYLALHDFPLLHGLVVKGVSDYGDSSKNDVYHTYAAHASAVYLLSFIQHYVTQETMPRWEAFLSEEQTASTGVWNVPYRRNPHFTGRDDLLERLQHQLSLQKSDEGATLRKAALTQPQAIKGLGGIGKTQIAVEYAYRCREQGRYTHTFWVNAASEEALMTSFTALADLLPAFSAKDEKDQRKLVAAIKRWLEQCQQPWLLVFDNTDDISLVQEYLPQWGNGSIVLTTRNDAVGSLATPLPVETMGFIEGTQLLLRRAGRFEHASDEEINEAGNIVAALDHFPLALDQAGAYIDETKCSFNGYLTAYQSHRKDLLARRGKQAHNYPESVATSWSLSFQRVEEANPAAADLLRICAFLAPDRIPEELLTEGAAHWTPRLQQAATNHFSFNEMIAALLTFSLVKRLTEEHMLSIHRLVQAVQIDTIAPEEQQLWATRVVLAVNQVFPQAPDDAATWPRCIHFLEQAQGCDRLIQHYRLILPEAADILNRTGKYISEHGLYTVAEPLFQRAISIREQRGDSEHLGLASVLHNLAILYKDQGRYTKGEPLFLRALWIREKQLGRDHSEVANSLNGLGELYREQGKHTEAESLHRRALHIREQQLGPDHPLTASSLNNLANLYKNQGKYDLAELLYKRSVYIKEQQLGPDCPQVAYALNGLANLYIQMGQYAEAEPLFQRALSIREHVLEPEHPLIAESLYGFATLRMLQGDFEEAANMHLRAFAIRKHVFGPQHAKTVETCERLRTVLTALGRREEADQLDKAQSEDMEADEKNVTH